MKQDDMTFAELDSTELTKLQEMEKFVNQQHRHKNEGEIILLAIKKD